MVTWPLTVLQILHVAFCNGPDLVKGLFSRLSEELRGTLSDSVGVAYPRAPGHLLKWVQDSVSKASSLQLLTAPPTSGFRQLPPVFFTLKTWAAWLGSTWAPRWCPRAARNSYPKPDVTQGWQGDGPWGTHTHTHTMPAKQKTTW